MEKDSDEELDYQPAPNSPSGNVIIQDDGEEDPLDAFMADVDKQVHLFLILFCIIFLYFFHFMSMFFFN